MQAGRSDLARERLEQGVKDFPEDRVLANSLARMLATAREENLRNGPRAVEIARNLYAAQPTPDVTETLAMALAETGDFAQAIAVQQGLIAQVRSAGQTGHLPRLEANLVATRRTNRFGCSRAASDSDRCVGARRWRQVPGSRCSALTTVSLSMTRRRLAP